MVLWGMKGVCVWYVFEREWSVLVDGLGMWEREELKQTSGLSASSAE